MNFALKLFDWRHSRKCGLRSLPHVRFAAGLPQTAFAVAAANAVLRRCMSTNCWTDLL
jgi:hypothetical protein